MMQQSEMRQKESFHYSPFNEKSEQQQQEQDARDDDNNEEDTEEAEKQQQQQQQEEDEEPEEDEEEEESTRPLSSVLPAGKKKPKAAAPRTSTRKRSKPTAFDPDTDTTTTTTTAPPTRPPPPPPPTAATDFRFVSYREKVRGYSDTGDAPRRMRHWLLKDALGREHEAVDTIRWEPSKKRFTYQAVPPFNDVLPLMCYNQRGVLEYLNRFVPPAARMAVSEVVGRGGAPGASSKIAVVDLDMTTAKESKGLNKHKNDSTATTTTATATANTMKAAALAAAALKSKSTKEEEENKKKRQKVSTKEGGIGTTRTKKPPTTTATTTEIIPNGELIHHHHASGTFISDPTLRSMARQLHLTTITRDLAALHAECGVHYSLTLAGSDGQMHVLTSAATAAAAAAAIPAPPPMPGYSLLPSEIEEAAAAGGGGGGGGGGASVDFLTAAAVEERLCGSGELQVEARMNGAAKSTKKRQSESAAAAADTDGNGDSDTDNGDGLPAPSAAAPSAAPSRDKRPRRQVLPSLHASPDVESLCTSMAENSKLYLTGRWQREPFPEWPLLETLETFQLAEDCGEAIDKDTVATKLTVHIPNVAAAGAGATSDPPTNNDILVVIDALPPPVSADMVAVQSVWGIDSYTRTLLVDALSLCPEFAEEATRDEFLDGEVLLAMNGLGADGWDILKALEHCCLTRNSEEEGDRKVCAAIMRVINALQGLEKHCNDGNEVKPAARKHVRAHAKGQGVLVTCPQGIPSGRFVGQYVGELYTAWRWAEREQRGGGGGGGAVVGAVAARKAATRMGASPEYYNIVLERPKADPRGYDVLYVDVSERIFLIFMHTFEANNN